MKYAVIETGGKQYQVSEGETLEVELVGEEKGTVSFDKVLLYVDGDAVKVGAPYLEGFSVKAKIEENFKADKVTVGKFKAKSRYRRLRGHRQNYSRVKIDKIVSK